MIAVAISIIDRRHSIQSTAIYTYRDTSAGNTHPCSWETYISLHEPAILKWTTELARFWLYNMYMYSYRTPIRVWGNVMSHTRMGYPIRVWDVRYAYGPTYAYGAEHSYTLAEY